MTRDPPASADPTRHRRRWPAVVFLTLGLGLGLGLGARAMAYHRAGQVLERAARQRGLSVTWGAIDLDLDGGVSVRDLTFRSLGEGRLAGRIGEIRTHLSPADAWAGRLPRSVTLRGMTVDCDEAGLRSLARTSVSESPVDDSIRPERGLRVEASSVDVTVRFGETRTVSCRAERVTAEGPTRAVRAILRCEAPFAGLQTGTFELSAVHDRSLGEHSLQVVAEPREGFTSTRAGARFGRVSASLGHESGRVEIADLSLQPTPQTGSPAQVEDLFLDLVAVELTRHGGGWRLARIAAGPGRVSVRPTHTEDASADEDLQPALDEEEEPVGLEEAAEAPTTPSLPRLDWESLEADLASHVARLDEGLGEVSRLADELRLDNISMAMGDGTNGTPQALLRRLEAQADRVDGLFEVGGHPLRLQVERAESEDDGDHVIHLSLASDTVDLARLSEWLGHPDLVSGQLDVRVDAELSDGIDVRLEIEADDLVFRVPAVSPEPLALLPLHVATSARFAPSDAVPLRIEAEIGMGSEVRATSTFEVSTAEGETRIDTTFAVAESDCQDWLSALPTGLFVHFHRDEVRIRGRAGLDGELRYILGNPRSFRLRLGESFPGTCEITRMPEGFRPEVLLEPDFRRAVPAEYLSEGAEPVWVGPGTVDYVPLDELPPYVRAIMYFTEQRLFYEEPAVSVRLINKAVRVNLIYGRWAYGGSTITQQLIKNLFLDRDKTLARKLEEALIAWAVFALVPRDRILELYINCIEFGPDIWGIEAAAQYYFGIGARELSPIQAVYLAGLKPSPRSGGSHRRSGHSPTRQRWRDRLRDRLQELADAGYIDQAYVDAQAPYVIDLAGEE